MDSDTEDYISEKLNQHRESGSSFDRLKGSGNLQICFMNEAAKDQEFGNPEEEESVLDKTKVSSPAPTVQKPTMHLPSTTLGKSDRVKLFCFIYFLCSGTASLNLHKICTVKFIYNRKTTYNSNFSRSC